jgi:hypothetical protein
MAKALSDGEPLIILKMSVAYIFMLIFRFFFELQKGYFFLC